MIGFSVSVQWVSPGVPNLSLTMYPFSISTGKYVPFSILTDVHVPRRYPMTIHFIMIVH